MRLSVEINTGPDTIYFVLPGTPGPDGPDGPKPLFRWKIPFFPTNHQALDKTPGRWKGSKDRIPGPDRPAPAGPAPARTCPPPGPARNVPQNLEIQNFPEIPNKSIKKMLTHRINERKLTPLPPNYQSSLATDDSPDC